MPNVGLCPSAQGGLLAQADAPICLADGPCPFGCWWLCAQAPLPCFVPREQTLQGSAWSWESWRSWGSWGYRGSSCCRFSPASRVPCRCPGPEHPAAPGTGGSLCWRLSQASLVLSGGSAGTGQSQPPSATFICKGQFMCAGQEVTELALLTLSPLSSVSPFSLVLPTLERAGTLLRLEKCRTPLLELQLHGITQAAE